MRTLKLSDFFHSIAGQSLMRQNSDGSFAAGHNGPYLDSETPVRNTAHWLFLYCRLLNRENDRSIKRAADKAVDYLLSPAARPMDATFWCRKNPEKDFCNGLMGQAWAMEGLVAAYESLGRDDALELARKVFFQHPWIEAESIWRRVAVDGSYLTPDDTFNHQLWFAAIASQLGDGEATRRALRFLEQIGQCVQTYSDGVIFHLSKLHPGLVRRNTRFSFLKGLLQGMDRQRLRNRLRSKSVGYHGFNLYAFAMLKEKFPAHPFWHSRKWNRMLSVTLTEEFVNELDVGPYGWHYNPSGLEIAYVSEVFGLGAENAQAWIDRQVSRTFCQERGDLLTKGVADVETSAARIYESARLEGDYRIRLDG